MEGLNQNMKIEGTTITAKEVIAHIQRVGRFDGIRDAVIAEMEKTGTTKDIISDVTRAFKRATHRLRSGEIPTKKELRKSVLAQIQRNDVLDIIKYDMRVLLKDDEKLKSMISGAVVDAIQSIEKQTQEAKQKKPDATTSVNVKGQPKLTEKLSNKPEVGVSKHGLVSAVRKPDTKVSANAKSSATTINSSTNKPNVTSPIKSSSAGPTKKVHSIAVVKKSTEIAKTIAPSQGKVVTKTVPVKPVSSENRKPVISNPKVKIPSNVVAEAQSKPLTPQKNVTLTRAVMDKHNTETRTRSGDDEEVELSLSDVSSVHTDDLSSIESSDSEDEDMDESNPTSRSKRRASVSSLGGRKRTKS